ncbi:MAG: Ada metal-binding domain-containing protein, partial [Shewanella sp.]
MLTDSASKNAIHLDEASSVQAAPRLAQLAASICREARMSRDPRFDGKFFVGVLTTGIYCRNVCPAVAPKEQNVRYFDPAAKAAQAGLRPCLRCRPDSAPGSNPWKGTGTTLARAMSLIEAGALAGKSSGEPASTVTQLADRLGLSRRYLHKLFTEGFG